jgi:hypothetical protein
MEVQQQLDVHRNLISELNKKINDSEIAAQMCMDHWLDKFAKELMKTQQQMAIIATSVLEQQLEECERGLIVFNVTDDPEENTRQKIQDLFGQLGALKAQFDCNRMGKFNPTKNRAIVVTLCSKTERSKILKAAIKKHKNKEQIAGYPSVFVAAKRPKAYLEIEKTYRERIAEARRLKQMVRWINHVLYVGEEELCNAKTHHVEFAVEPDKKNENVVKLNDCGEAKKKGNLVCMKQEVASEASENLQKPSADSQLTAAMSSQDQIQDQIMAVLPKIQETLTAITTKLDAQTELMDAQTELYLDTNQTIRRQTGPSRANGDWTD